MDDPKAAIIAAIKDGSLSIGDVIARANAIRQRLDLEDEQYKARISTPKSYLAALANVVHLHLQTSGLQNMKGTDGSLAFRKKKITVTVADWDVVWGNIVATQNWDLLNHAVNKTAVQAIVDETGLVPPGVNYAEFEEVQFRQPRKKGSTDGTENEE